MPRGLLALTVEVCDEAPGGACWQLLPSLRYAHVPARLLALARQHGFDAVKVERAPVRHDQGRPVDGLYVVLQRMPV
jgi:predicted TPR repeat methyltransferase